MSDLMKDGQFGEQWLVLTEKEVSVWGTDGRMVSKLFVSSITDARVVGGVGGGSLLVDTKEGPMILIRYTASLTSIFGFASKLIARSGQRPLKKNSQDIVQNVAILYQMILKLVRYVKATARFCFGCSVMPNLTKFK